MRRGLPFCAALLALACESEPAPVVWDQVGDPCNSPAWCTDEGVLRECQERRWADVDCDARCAAEGLQNAGCKLELQGARCLCEACPGPLTCLDADTIEICSNGEKVSQSCTEHCLAAGYDTAHGCHTNLDQVAACQCSHTTTCTAEGQAGCVDWTQLATCQSGAWSVVDCTVTCNDPDAVCTFDPDTTNYRCSC